MSGDLGEGEVALDGVDPMREFAPGLDHGPAYSVCPEDPRRLRGAPIGMYHCPACGCMVVAGMAHWPHDEGCLLALNEPLVFEFTCPDCGWQTDEPTDCIDGYCRRCRRYTRR